MTTDYGAWTCPTCGRTVTAGLLGPSQWQTQRLRVQKIHAELHAATGRTR